MDLRVEELAHAAGVRVDTVRFYQGRGLIPPPTRVGRVAIYTAEHLERIKEIRSLLDQGFSLAQIARLAEAKLRENAARGADAEPALLEALVEESVGRQGYSRYDFAAETGLPDALLTAVQNAGLIAPVQVEGEERFTQSDVDLAKAGMALLQAGLPIAELLAIASDHVRHVQELTDAGIDLFDDHIRKRAPDLTDDEATAVAFRELLPEVTRVVALHFQRTLVNRALERLRRAGDSRALEAALEATKAGQLEVEWR